ncbi:hypothetical protein [Pseudonocardia alni]
MPEVGVRHLLVTRDGLPAGIGSVRDVLAVVLDVGGPTRDGPGRDRHDR